MTKLMFAGLLCVILGAASALAPGLQAATLTVTNADDDGPGSLREAIYLASNGDEIQFDAGLAGTPIILTGGELLIDKDLTITGLGQQQITLDGNATSRIVRIAEQAAVTLSMLTIRNGFQQEIVDGPYGDAVIAEGGGIYNAGTLTLNDSSVEGNTISSNVCAPSYCILQGISVKGGGIFNSGTAVLNRCAINDNRGDAYRSYGGGIYNSGQAILLETEITNNSGYSDRYSGLKGLGLFNDTPGTVAIIDGSVTGNSQGSSHAIVNQGFLTLTRTTMAGNKGWRGGALFNIGTATLQESSVSYNETWAGGGNAGEAGGITSQGTLTLVRSTVADNQGVTIGGSGGIVNSSGVLRVINTTLSENYGERAGGIRGPALIVGSTISGNRINNCWDLSGGGTGGLLSSPSGAVVRNTIIAGNFCNLLGPGTQPADCLGTLESLGHSLLGDERYCYGLIDGSAGDIVGVDWTTVLESRPYYFDGRLLPITPRLDQNGGPTPTVALLPDSPAIDAIPPEACTDMEGNPITTDQRGVPRPQGEGCDIGAFEFSLPRGAGFWAHQCSDRGFHQVSPEEMQALFTKIADTSSVFPECAPTGCEALNPQLPRNDLRLRAQQALLDVWLNLVSGRLTRGRPIDLPDLTSATTVAEALSQLEMTVCDSLATRSDLGNAKEIAEALNSSADDMELAARESTVTLLPGATRTIALGLINMSPGDRNYSLTASGPWPVQLSATLINALGSGQVAPITATITAPWDAQATTAQIRITAMDLITQGTLSRDVTITLTFAGDSPPE